MPPQPPIVAKATLCAANNGTPFPVHFNPTSLVYSIENSSAKQSGAPKTTQFGAQFSAKLTMDLQFDSTDSGSDVRDYTNKVAYLMQPQGSASANTLNNPPAAANSDGEARTAPANAPPIVIFQWGTYQFQGIIDSFKETIDFFSAEGVPLRAMVSLGMSRQDLVLEKGADVSGPNQSGSLVPSSGSDSALSLATRGGDPSAARQLGTDNGLASLRFTGGVAVQVGAGVQLNPPAAFATAASASGGAGLSLGISASASAGGLSGGLGAAFGGSASAGVPATAGAFAGLQTGLAQLPTSANLDPLLMLPATSGSDVSAFAGASLSLGGASNSTGSAGLSADVGAQSSFKDRLTFSSDD